MISVISYCGNIAWNSPGEGGFQSEAEEDIAGGYQRAPMLARRN
jgi:hypothetical protein